MADGDLPALELIGGPDLPEQIVIVDYDPEWPRRFGQFAERIRSAGGDRVRIEHIGSTAVPGLAAKPIIDLLVVVDDLDNEVAYVEPLEDAGFVLRAREPGHRLFRTSARDVHVHVYQSGAGEIADYLRLRDRLRVSAADRELYASTKRRLAARRWTSMQDYAVAKSEVIADILSRATPGSVVVGGQRLGELLAAEEQLEQAAAAVRRDLSLHERLAMIGDPVLVGSAALRVMVRRDIDITTVCPDLSDGTADTLVMLAAGLVRHPRVRAVHIRDDTGRWNVDSGYPDGWYIGLEYRGRHGEEWTLDLWFVADRERQPDLVQLERIRPALTIERRVAILAIKQARSSGPNHPPGLSSRIYDAVVEHGVETVEQFDRWNAAESADKTRRS